MPDESALRTDTDERNDETGTPANAPSAARRRPTENSLLADLLSETSNEAQRELDQIKAELQSRKDAELEARRSADRQRRAELDRLREAELKRREAALRSPSSAENSVAGTSGGAQQSTAAAYDPTLAITPKKSSGPIYAVAAVLIAAIATTGWYFTTKEKVQAEVQAAEKNAEAVATAATEEKNDAAKGADGKTGDETVDGTPKTAGAKGTTKEAALDSAKADAEKAAAAVAIKRLAASESEALRRVPEVDVPQYIKPKRKYRRGRKRRGPGKGKIKIRGLNLGAGR